MNKEKRTISMAMDRDLCDRLDAYAKKYSLTRSGAINVIVSMQLNQEKVIDKFPELMEAIDKISGKK